MSGENKIVDPYRSMISPFTSRHVVKLWQNCEKVCGAKLPIRMIYKFYRK